MVKNPYAEIERLENLPLKDAAGHVSHCVFQEIDFTKAPEGYAPTGTVFEDCCFLGCTLPARIQDSLGPNCMVFPHMKMIYNCFRNSLYTGESLYEGYDLTRPEESFEEAFDTRVYRDFVERGTEAKDIIDTLARSMHDHSISDAMGDFLAGYDEKDVVAVMGGHASQRTDNSYRDVALISKELTECGRLMCSGGGPGAMEATHFGAWMAGYSPEEFEDALAHLRTCPGYKDPKWLKTAFEVMRKYPRKEAYHSLGIPTWLYGHEPATPFASDIAKYFQNSIREDLLLTIAKGGIIYSTGSAGTVQEIFQDCAQNHYQTFGYASPMVFLGKDFFTKEIPVYPFLQDLMARGKFKNLILSLADSPEEAVAAIKAFN